MILFAAALRNIPGEVLESARMENSNAVQTFFRITLPLRIVNVARNTRLHEEIPAVNR